MNIHASPIKSAAQIQRFKVGDFVRIQNGETVGRVLEDTDANGSTAVKVFDDDSFGDNPKFGPGILSMWTPSPATHVAPDVVVRPVIDTVLAFELLLKIVAANDLSGNLARLEMSNGLRDGGDLLPLNMEFIHTAIDDTLGDLLDMIETEERRQEAESGEN
jgi:hypothetical protein